MAYTATLPVEHVGEIIGQHLHSALEKGIRDALNKVVAPMVTDMAREYAQKLAEHAVVQAGHNHLKDSIEIHIQLKGE